MGLNSGVQRCEKSNDGKALPDFWVFEAGLGLFLGACQRWRLPGGCPVYPAHAPALCLPWHSR